MLDAPFPRLLPGRPGTSTEGRTFIATLKEDAASALRIREAGGDLLREKDGTLIWGFAPEVTQDQVEALCLALRPSEADPVIDAEAAAPVPGPAAEGWNFDIDAAPKGDEKRVSGKVAGTRAYERSVHVREKIFAAGNGGVVTVSSWIPEQGRWNMFTKAVPPMAWRPFEEGAPMPRHPLAG